MPQNNIWSGFSLVFPVFFHKYERPENIVILFLRLRFHISNSIILINDFKRSCYGWNKIREWHKFVFVVAWLVALVFLRQGLNMQPSFDVPQFVTHPSQAEQEPGNLQTPLSEHWDHSIPSRSQHSLLSWSKHTEHFWAGWKFIFQPTF